MLRSCRSPNGGGNAQCPSSRASSYESNVRGAVLDLNLAILLCRRTRRIVAKIDHS
jgi:hypothetical protein